MIELFHILEWYKSLGSLDLYYALVSEYFLLSRSTKQGHEIFSAPFLKLNRFIRLLRSFKNNSFPKFYLNSTKSHSSVYPLPHPHITSSLLLGTCLCASFCMPTKQKEKVMQWTEVIRMICHTLFMIQWRNKGREVVDFAWRRKGSKRGAKPELYHVTWVNAHQLANSVGTYASGGSTRLVREHVHQNAGVGGYGWRKRDGKGPG